MTIERSPLLELDKAQVIGYLTSAGSRDPDVLHARKARLVSLARFPKVTGTSVMVMGVLCTALILPAVVGIPLLVLGWWMRHRGVQNLRAVETGWAEFLGEEKAMANVTSWYRVLVAAGILAGAALSAGLVRAQQTCDQLPRGVVGWWSGDDTANDLTTNANQGQLMNGATFGPGAIADGFHLDGVNDRIDVADAPYLHLQTFTLAAWVRLDAILTQSCIICKQYASGDADSFSLWLASGVLRGGMFGFTEAVGTTALPLNQFVFTAVTYDGSIIRLYQDGKLIALAPGPTGPIPYDGNQVIIGADDNGVNAYTGFLPGTIDEAQIFGRALSDCEIEALYRARPRGNCKGDSDGDLVPDAQDNCPSISNAAQVDADADGAGDLCDCAPADPGVMASPGDRNLLRCESQDGVDWCRDPSVTGTSTTYDVIRGNLDALPVTSGASVCRSRCTAPLPGLAAWWPGDGNTTDLVAGNNGTLLNGATYGTGLVHSSFSLDGVNDTVKSGNLALGNAFSVAAWVNSSAVNQGAYHRILETSYAAGFELGTDGTGTQYKFIVKNAAAPYGLANGGALSPGDWQLVVGTYDGTTGILYVDGKAVGSDAFAAPGPVNLPVYIGAYVGGGAGWKGRIDEVQVYNRTLSAAEVRTLYESGSSGQCKAALGGTDAVWTTPWAADLSVPPPGHGYWYLYRGRNTCGVGSYGFATSGAERTSAACD